MMCARAVSLDADRFETMLSKTMPVWAVAVPLAAALAAGFAPSFARAEDAPAAATPRAPGLNWVRLAGAETCIGSAELALRVEARAGRALFATPGEAALFVDGHVGLAAPAGWRVELAVVDPQGRVLGRRALDFQGNDCSVIDEAVTLVIAVTLYPNTGLPESGIPLDPGIAASLDSLFGAEPTEPDASAMPPASQPPRSSRQSVRRPVASPARRSSAPATPGIELGLDAVGVTGFGQLPGAALALAAHAVLALREGLSVELGFTRFFTASEQPPRGIDGEAKFDLWVASLAVCPWQPSGLPALSLCVGAEGGRLQAETRGFAIDQPPMSEAVANVLGEGVLRARLGSTLYLRAALTIALPLVQRSYTFQDLDGSPAVLFRMPQVAGRAEIGAGMFF